ncbi:hypothetical protein BDB00DRAFT_787530 [Zychaea mexicana]|uniref:uncharacterized protein n=1 Tax=Zychaea mexicana TaxID=64656 RepID=UPI0022FEC56F|nr:uncharacterized protein BDB00DRAFT_787530 [Zychaea mexicana]KAI9493848.1 hypothetical protein BDB00DRAFT_787530 [Zychaea mexicana]
MQGVISAVSKLFFFNISAHQPFEGIHRMWYNYQAYCDAYEDLDGYHCFNEEKQNTFVGKRAVMGFICYCYCMLIHDVSAKSSERQKNSLDKLSSHLVAKKKKSMRPCAYIQNQSMHINRHGLNRSTKICTCLPSLIRVQSTALLQHFSIVFFIGLQQVQRT